MVAVAADLVDHLVGWALVVAGAVEVDAGVVDHYASAFLGEEERHAPADASAGAGDDRGLSFKGSYLKSLPSRLAGC